MRWKDLSLLNMSATGFGDRGLLCLTATTEGRNNPDLERCYLGSDSQQVSRFNTDVVCYNLWSA